MINSVSSIGFRGAGASIIEDPKAREKRIEDTNRDAANAVISIIDASQNSGKLTVDQAKALKAITFAVRDARPTVIH